MEGTADESWDCFIAYPAPQRAVAEQLAGHLARRVRVFFDRHALRPGDDWPRAIAAAIEASRVTVVIVSPETERAFYEQEEITRAVQRARDPGADHRVVPIFVDGMTPSDPRVPYGLRVKQGYTITSHDDLVRAAEAIAATTEEIAFRLEMDSGGESRDVSETIRLHLASMRVEVDQLTREQYRVIHQLRFMRRVRISGSAGSGKTLVAAEKATRLAAGGARVLFLCHNPLLAEHVLQLVAGRGIEVRDFVRWVNELTDTAAPQDDDWTHYHEPTQATLDRALEQLAAGSGRVDAIVVDEGQDFRAEWWQVVQAGLISHDNGCLYIFHDNNQSLLAHRSSYPIAEPHIDLSRNCRNAGRVLELMRCFDSSTPEAELGLRVRGRVALRRYQPGGEVEAFIQLLTNLEREQLLEHTVVITTSDDPLAALPLVGREIALATTGPWQDEVRRQFHQILHVYHPYGLTEPTGGEPWIAAELDGLSSSAVPSAADIELVRQIAAAFAMTRDVRRFINHPKHQSTFSWQLHDRAPRLRRRVRGPVWAAEVILYFERDDWARGLPAPKTVVVQPFHLPRTRGVLPLYRVSDFKGLEAEVVVLLMRGRVGNQKAATYVGVSRARALLCILTDGVAASALPKSFAWD